MQLNYVLCPSYHGATLLAVLLSNHPRISSLGDALPSLDYMQRCSCGEKVDSCDFWTDLLQRLHPDGNKAKGSFVDKLVGAFPMFQATRLDQVFAVAGLALGNWVWFLRQDRIKFADTYMRFWGEVQKKHGTDFFVDGEKSITKAVMLKSLFGKMADVRVLHLTRDPRGFLNSCRKYVDGVTVDQVAAMWNHHANIVKLQNAFFKCRYMQLRYEDLCADPDGCMAKVFKFYGVPNQNVVKKPDAPAKNHMMGNNMLMRFDGKIRLDTTWKDNLTAEDQQRILALTAPLSGKLGYA